MPDALRLTDAELMARLRSLTPEDHELLPVPDDVWDSVRAGIEDTAPVIAFPDPVRAARRARQRRHRGRAGGIVVGMLSAAAALGGVLWWALRPQPDEVIAEASLSSEGLQGAPSGLTGSADVVEEGGRQTLQLSLPSLSDASDEYFEVWLLKPDVSGLVSLGALRDDGAYQIPAGLSLNDYSVVDVSVEPYDGNPAHSGSSVLRGQLEDAPLKS